MPLSAQKDYQLLFYETSPPRIRPKYERSPTTASLPQFQQQQQQQRRLQPGNISPTNSIRTFAPGGGLTVGGSTPAMNNEHGNSLKISPPSATIRTAAEFITHHRSLTSATLANSNVMLKSSVGAPSVSLVRQTTAGEFGTTTSMAKTKSSMFRNRGQASLTSLELKPATVEGNNNNNNNLYDEFNEMMLNQHSA